MSVQMYLVHPKGEDEDREALAEFIALRQGWILMATSAGSLIVAFDEAYVDAVRAHPSAELVGGLSFNPHGKAAEKLQKLFAHNVAQQLAARQRDMQVDGRPGPHFPPGYRPLTWPRRENEEKS
jgi:hypothetical protein